MDRQEKLEEYFEQALALEPDERTAFLAKIEREDRELGKELSQLLNADEKTSSLLDVKPEDLATIIPTAPLPENIGPYKILGKLGEGGMAVVLRAERVDIPKPVALKRIRDQYAGPNVLTRFQQEQAVLARLSHPNIAQLLDAGIDDLGAPYFAMELVEGKTITDYSSALPVERKLELFRKVCDAVHYAHQNLVVHRDLKPSNILVDQSGQVKLLDFGIARVLEADEENLITQTGMRVLTPAYASPEQIKGESLSTASDIYSLGLVLYELLTSKRAYDLEGKSAGEVEQLITAYNPPRPSVHINRLSGDLDKIVLKALRKEAEGRYASAADFGQDIGRYLEGRPVEAQETTWTYRARKFVARNRLLVAAGLLGAILLSALVGQTVWSAKQQSIQAEQISQEAAKAEAVSEFLIQVFEEANPNNARGDTLNAFQILDRGVEKIDALSGEPNVQASVQEAVSGIYRSLSRHDEAEELALASLETREKIYPDSHVEKASSFATLGQNYQWQGQYAKADSCFGLAINMIESLHGKEHPDWVAYANPKGRAMLNLGKHEEAEQLFRQALENGRLVHGQEHEEISRSLDYLGRSLTSQGDYEEALPYSKEAIQMAKNVLGPDHPDVANRISSLASLYFNMGDDQQALGLQREALALGLKIWGAEHPTTAGFYSNLAGSLRNLGQTEEAIEIFEEALEIFLSIYGPTHSNVAAILHNLGNTQRDIGLFGEAEKAFNQMLEIDIAQLGDAHSLVGVDMHMIASLQREKGDYRRAYQSSEEALTILRAALAEDHRHIGHARVGQGIIQMYLNQLDLAEENLRKGIETIEKAYKDGHWTVEDSKSWLGSCLLKKGHFEEAEILLKSSYEQLLELKGAEDRYTIRTKETLDELNRKYRNG